MNVDAKTLQAVQNLLDANRDIVSRKQEEVLNIGCSMCANCSGIVGG